MGFGNLKVIIDDLHKEVVKSDPLARKFQSIRHSGIEMLFVTQSFKNINMHNLIKENFSFVLLFKLSQNKMTLRNCLSDLSVTSTTARVRQKFRSSFEYIFAQTVQRNDSIMTFDEDNTCYLYIGMPKRGCKKVCDVRTAISNPNREICFEEIGCNSCKILFSEREKPLNYDNRFKYVPMKVMSEKDQNTFLQQAPRQQGNNNNNASSEEEEEEEEEGEESTDNKSLEVGDRKNVIFQQQQEKQEKLV